MLQIQQVTFHHGCMDGFFQPRSDNSCELFELENALNPGSASGCTKPAGRAARPAHTCLDLHPGSLDCTIQRIENVNLTPVCGSFVCAACLLGKSGGKKARGGRLRER